MDDDVEWLTYDDLADRLGIERESARTLVKRRRWERRPGNDGKARIGVPIQTLSRGDPGSEPGDEPPVEPGDDPQVEPVVPEAAWREIIAGLDARVADLRADVERERIERLRERDRADVLVDRVAAVAGELAQAVAEAATRERELVQAAADATARAAAAEATIAEYRTRPWWRRIAG